MKWENKTTKKDDLTGKRGDKTGKLPDLVGRRPGELGKSSDQVGADYEAEIHVTENDTPVGEFWISKGTLPAGLELIRLSPLPSSMGYHAAKRSLPLVPL